MHVSLAAAKSLQEVVDRGRTLDDAISFVSDDFDGSMPELREIAYGSCRFYIYFDAVLGQLLTRPVKKRDRIIHFLLVCALYRIDKLGVPEYAVVNEAVNSLKGSRQSWAGSLVNGVLRQWLRKRGEGPATNLSGYEESSFPRFLFEQICQDWPEYCSGILSTSNQRPPLTLRINGSCTTREEYRKLLVEAGIDHKITSDSKHGVTLSTPRPVSEIPGFDSGLVSVQDESAQLSLEGLEPVAGYRILDGCAAPGGKLCMVLEQEPAPGHVIGVDLPERIDRVHENLVRLKLDAEVIATDVAHLDSWWDGKPFDRILLDVPCTGSGVIRRHPDIRFRRKSGDIEKFAARQLELVESVWPALRPGGTLLYVTCSVFQAENDGVIETFSQSHTDFALQSAGEFPAIHTGFGLQRLPGLHSGDGFYYSRLEKLAG